MKFYLSLYGHRLPVMALDVSDDSQMIASGSADKNVRPTDERATRRTGPALRLSEETPIAQMNGL